MAEKASTPVFSAENIVATLEGDILVLRIDTSKSVGMSSTGKNLNVATTRGNVSVPVNGKILKLGVNCYTSPK